MPFPNWRYVEGTSAWGENSSKYDFCETNFYITPYIAEFINTISNIGYIYLGTRGIINNRRIRNDGVIVLCYGLLSCVGIGSAIYHAAPKYFSQMIDEMSMLYATAGILYGALSITLGSGARKWLAVLLFSLTALVSVTHCFLGHVKAFRLCWLFMILSVFGQCVWLLSTKVSDAKVKKLVISLALHGSVSFVGGFILWTIDQKFCAELSSARLAVGMPLGFVTELHGWWHLLTGLGVYYFIVFIEYLRIYFMDANAHLTWRHSFSLPFLEAIRRNKNPARKA